jgi:tRNA nucleotidyltransferase (CCA-adding enzyme)
MNDIFNAIYKVGGSPYFVGGYVRDSVLGLKPKDIDIEVFGLSPDELLWVLTQFGEVDSVGVSFGILKLKRNGQEFDFSTAINFVI